MGMTWEQEVANLRAVYGRRSGCRVVEATVNGERAAVVVALTTEMNDEPEIRDAYIARVVQNELAFKAERWWGPGTLVAGENGEYLWK